MKALSVKAPWAELLCLGIKTVENRRWRTNYRGKILIHVPIKYDTPRKPEGLLNFIQWGEIPANTRMNITQKQMPTSCIIGEVEIVDCIKGYKSIWRMEGQWQWILKNPVLYRTKIEDVKGSLSLWNYNIPTLQCRGMYNDGRTPNFRPL